jgi:toluene monooxygenase system protein D
VNSPQGKSRMTSDEKPRLVGPVITCGEFADAVLESMQEDNPDKIVIVEQNTAYMRIKVEGECILRMATLARALGRPVRRGDLEMNMPSFAGFIQTLPDHVRFFSK